ncbi:MAG: hypothetical protein AC479_04495 [miscellaneous Crenarchaeota group-6 archaeon AD8-1]|nr:MAG: hypothetical protein AC479_04495 [miscellaneous Crenarchaeota group-6 archaeon AD8-1]
MKEIIFVGLGLNDEKGVSIRGLEEIKSAKNVFIELYTNLMPNFSIDNLRKISGKNPYILSRYELEEEKGEIILKAAERGKTIFLVPGDPLIATTHISLRLEAKKRKIKTSVIHGTSVISAIIGATGLHKNFSETPYDVIAQNKINGLHTLCLLDINAKKKQFLSINDALKILLDIETKRKQKLVNFDTLVVGAARIGSISQFIKADYLSDLIKTNFGGPPQSLIFPGELHFMETEALISFAKAPREIMEVKK